MEKIIFEDLPSTNTPINSTNLNQLQNNIENAINGIVESGRNSNGSYIKFTDGTMIVRQTFTQGPIPFTNALIEGKLYAGNPINCPDYPAQFIETPQISLQARNNIWGVIVLPDNTTPASNISAGTYILLRYGTQNNGFNASFDLIAIGRWK